MNLRRLPLGLLVALAAALVGAGPRARAIDNADCLGCHADADLKKAGPDGKEVSVHVDQQAYGASIHGKNLCTSCHSDITEVPHPEGFKPQPVSCSACHRLETEIYRNSDHGQAIAKGESEAASCKDCHGHSHTLLNSRNPNSPVNRAHIPETCGRCHGNTREMERYNLPQRAVVVTYDQSVHGLAHSKGNATAAVCSDCHGTHDLHRGTNPESKLFWQKIPVTCGKCHENVRQTYQRSVHGGAVTAGLRDAPVCTDCHGEHTVTAVKEARSKVGPAHIPETCGQCHGAERIASKYELSTGVVQSYMQSFHGLALQFGGLAVANCASCHGFHDILPSTDPQSSVNQQNLPQTCGKCHPGIGTRLASGELKIHNLPGAAKGKPWLVNFIARFYIAIIVLTIGGMLAFNGLDYVAKTRAHVRAVRAGDGEWRLPRLVRYQHLTMMILFIVLVYTGFVHRFPDAMWSAPFTWLANGSALRGLIHRIAGWGMVALFALHLGALFCTPRGHVWLRDLWFRCHDLKDGLDQLLFNLGLRRTPPPPRRFNYAEKAEYWALVWGSIVMIVTGIMLVFTETVLRILPKIWLDVAQVVHFYEALLATLAIVVWHFYWVIFDPKEYPMNPAWLIGKKAPHPHAPAPVPPPATAPPPAAPAEGAPDEIR